MNPNFTGHLIESHYRTAEAERRASAFAALGPLPKRTWFAWLHRRPSSQQPVALAARQAETSSSCAAKAA